MESSSRWRSLMSCADLEFGVRLEYLDQTADASRLTMPQGQTETTSQTFSPDAVGGDTGAVGVLWTGDLAIGARRSSSRVNSSQAHRKAGRDT